MPAIAGKVIANKDKNVAATSSNIATIKLALPPVVTVEVKREVLVKPLIKLAEPPPAIIATVH